MLNRLAALLFVPLMMCAGAIGADAVYPIFGMDPPDDMSSTLGQPTKRWATVYTGKLTDGAGNAVTIKQLADAVAASNNSDHSELTIESRSAPAQHPMGAITGLLDALNQKASTAVATQESAGLMSAEDKRKLDILASFLSEFQPPANSESEEATE